MCQCFSMYFNVLLSKTQLILKMFLNSFLIFSDRVEKLFTRHFALVLHLQLVSLSSARTRIFASIETILIHIILRFAKDITFGNGGYRIIIKLLESLNNYVSLYFTLKMFVVNFSGISLL